MSKYKLFGGITVLGILCTLLGAWMKILHLANAQSLLTIGMFAEAIGLSALAWFLFEWLEKKKQIIPSFKTSVLVYQEDYSLK